MASCRSFTALCNRPYIRHSMAGHHSDIVNLKQASGGDLDFFNDPLYKDQVRAAVSRPKHHTARPHGTG